MKRIHILLLAFLGILLLAGFNLSSAVILEGEEELHPAYHPDNLIRLRILPHNNLQKEQELKTRLRDHLLEETQDLFYDVSCKEKAQSILQTNLHRIKERVKEILEEEGVDHPTQIEYQEILFPGQQYGELMLPPGFYFALQVTVGDGQGENWWCVLFPPLCFMDSMEKISAQEGGRTQEEDGIPMEFRFRLFSLYPHVSSYLQHLYQRVLMGPYLHPQVQAQREVRTE